MSISLVSQLNTFGLLRCTDDLLTYTMNWANIYLTPWTAPYQRNQCIAFVEFRGLLQLFFIPEIERWNWKMHWTFSIVTFWTNFFSFKILYIFEGCGLIIRSHVRWNPCGVCSKQTIFCSLILNLCYWPYAQMNNKILCLGHISLGFHLTWRLESAHWPHFTISPHIWSQFII